MILVTNQLAVGKKVNNNQKIITQWQLINHIPDKSELKSINNPVFRLPARTYPARPVRWADLKMLSKMRLAIFYTERFVEV